MKTYSYFMIWEGNNVRENVQIFSTPWFNSKKCAEDFLDKLNDLYWYRCNKDDLNILLMEDEKLTGGDND